MALDNAKTSLPVRTEANGDVKSSIVDIDTPSVGAAVDATQKRLKVESRTLGPDGSVNSAANPIFVAESGAPGDERYDYDLADDIAPATPTDHDYSVTNAAKLYDVLVSAPGRATFEIQIETAAASGIFNTVRAIFTSASAQNAVSGFTLPKVVPAGAIVRVIKTNNENGSQTLDMTSLIELIEE